MMASYHHADDCLLIRSGYDVDDIVNGDLASLAGWYRSNKIYLNQAKTEAMIFKKSGVQQQAGTNKLKIDYQGPEKFWEYCLMVIFVTLVMST